MQLVVRDDDGKERVLNPNEVVRVTSPSGGIGIARFEPGSKSWAEFTVEELISALESGVTS